MYSLIACAGLFFIARQIASIFKKTSTSHGPTPPHTTLPVHPDPLPAPDGVSPKLQRMAQALQTLRDQHLTGKPFGEAFVKNYFELVIAPPSKWPRRYPQMTGGDTQNGRVLGHNMNALQMTPEEQDLVKQEAFGMHSTYPISSAHPTAHSYSDSSIQDVYPLNTDAQISSPFFMGKTMTNHYVILQNGLRGCSTAVSAMLASDRLQRFIEPRFTNLGDDSTIQEIFQQNNLKHIMICLKDTPTLDALSASIQKYGSACVAVDSGAGGHYIVVDQILPNHRGVVIRDPYHGWCVLIAESAFMQSVSWLNPISHAAK